MSDRVVNITVKPTDDGSRIKVVFDYDGDCVSVDTLRPIEAMKMAREFSVAAAQLTAYAVENLE